MNILVIIPDIRCKDQYIHDWQIIKPPIDNISILVLKNEQDLNPKNGRIYYLEYNFNKYQIFFGKLITKYSSWNGLLHLVWKKLISNQIGEFIFCIRSIDPDIVDLRSLNLEQQLIDDLSKKIQPIRIIFDDGDDKSVFFKNEFRKYNPDLKVSIVLPVYNGEKFIRKSIESCLIQTHRNLELIIVDDCSTDKTLEILQECGQKDPRIKIIRNNLNKRLPGALNIGFSHTTGELLTWTSDDNYFDPDALELLVRYLCTWQDVDFVYSAYRIIDERGFVEETINYLPPPWNLPYENTVGAYFLYRRSVYESVGDFDQEMEYLEDYDYWVRVYLKNLKMMRLHIPRYFYRHHAGSMTSHARQFSKIIWDNVRSKYFHDNLQ